MILINEKVLSMRLSPLAALTCAALLLASVAGPARAAPDEIQVYTEELDEPGESGVELHVNFVPSGRKSPTYPGEMRSDHRLQVTPELSYGLTKTLEAGLYLPIATSPDGGGPVSNGMRFRLKYIAPREEGQRFFWGLNGELGWYSKRISESRTALEMRPIVGWRDEHWLFAFNPILDFDLAGDGSHRPSFDPALKLAHTIRGDTMIGVETYREYGPLGNFLPGGERPTYVYATIDTSLGGADVNFGVGRGLQGAEDRWVVKAIVALPFR
jgi:hypothetical protein